MSARITNPVFRIFPYLWRRGALPSPGSQNLVFETVALPHYNPIGGGLQNSRQIMTFGAWNYPPRLVGVVGPGGFQHGQTFNPPLVNTSG